MKLSSSRFPWGLSFLVLFGITVAISLSHAADVPRNHGSTFRRTSLVTLNDLSQAKLNPHVEGVGVLPFRLGVTEEGSWHLPRNTTVFIAIYEPGSKSRGRIFGTKTLLTTWRSPNSLTTPAGVSRSEFFAADVPLLPGGYTYYLFLCDPDVPYGTSGLTHQPEFPDPEAFPGDVRLTLYGTGTVH